jgi:hypothetical protein
MPYPQTLETFSQLRPGDRIEMRQEVKVGFDCWQTTVTGTVVSTERRRHGLHMQRNPDDKVFSDFILLRRDDGELTTVAIDEFCELKKIEID